MFIEFFWNVKFIFFLLGWAGPLCFVCVIGLGCPPFSTRHRLLQLGAWASGSGQTERQTKTLSLKKGGACWHTHIWSAIKLKAYSASSWVHWMKTAPRPALSHHRRWWSFSATDCSTRPSPSRSASEPCSLSATSKALALATHSLPVRLFSCMHMFLL